jgi:hypothetical protein
MVFNSTKKERMNKIIEYLKIASEAWKGLLAVAGAVTVIAVAAVKVDHFKSKDVNTDLRLKDINQSVTSLDYKMDSILVTLHLVGEIKDDMKELRMGQKNIVNALGDHMAKDKTVTKDDMINFMRQFQIELKKNSESSLWMIPLNQNTSQIR